jgi:alpha-tubulin suppressor-like RCC1 family protein
MKTPRNLVQICLLCAVLLQVLTIGAQPVTKIAAGDLHSLFLKSDGSLWAMGLNSFGQLGDGTYSTPPNFGTNQPEMIVTSNVTAIAAGDKFSLFLKSDGSLWAMGFNGYGQLGDGTYNNTNQPEMVVASNVSAIAAEEITSLFLKSDGSLWGMGNDEFGQLGEGYIGGYFNSTNLPQQLVASNVTAIAAGYLYSLFVKCDGSLWGMGLNSFGQLGDGTYTAQINQPEQVVANSVTAIAGGFQHTLFLKNDGSLWAMGDNGQGQLGDGTTDNGNFETNLPEEIVVNPAYNKISIQHLSGGNVGLSYVGIAGTNYALDLSFSLSPASWIPQVTNTAGTGGVLVFTNTPDATTNNFWRIRSVP